MASARVWRGQGLAWGGKGRKKKKKMRKVSNHFVKIFLAEQITRGPSSSGPAESSATHITSSGGEGDGSKMLFNG